MSGRRGWSGLLMFAWLLAAMVPRQAWACAVCFGAPDAPQTKGLNAGIIVLLGVTAVVLGGFMAMIVGFIVRTKRLAQLANTPTT